MKSDFKVTDYKSDSLQLNKSITQRTKNIQSYEKTIIEAEQRYGELVISSGFLVKTLKDNSEYLDESMGNKKVGPDAEPSPKPVQQIEAKSAKMNKNGPTKKVFTSQDIDEIRSCVNRTVLLAESFIKDLVATSSQI